MCTQLFKSKINTLSLPLPHPGTAIQGSKGSLIPQSDTTTSGQPSTADFAKFVPAFLRAQTHVVIRFRRRNTWRLWEFFRDGNAEDVAIINQWLDSVVKEVREEHIANKKEKKAIEEDSFLDYLVASTDGECLSCLNLNDSTLTFHSR